MSCEQNYEFAYRGTCPKCGFVLESDDFEDIVIGEHDCPKEKNG